MEFKKRLTGRAMYVATHSIGIAGDSVKQETGFLVGVPLTWQTQETTAISFLSQ